MATRIYFNPDKEGITSFDNADFITTKSYFVIPSSIKSAIHDNSITTGSRQLLLAQYLKLNNGNTPDKIIKTEINKNNKSIKGLEKLLEATPTFGCEFYLEREAVENLDTDYNFSDKVRIVNTLLDMAGNAGNKGIRTCTNYGDTIELRINPSYAPVIVALIKELFELGILPKDILIGYSINMVGKDVLENGIPLILVNYFTGIATQMPSNDGELAFRDVHVYRGATVNAKTGVLETGTPQLNIFAGVTAKVESNEQLKPYKFILENDIEERFNRMLLPFLVSPQYRARWKQAIYEIFGFTSKEVELLEKRLKDAENENKVWKTNRDLKIFGSQRIKDKIKELYALLEDRVIRENPQTYLAIENFEKINFSQN